jgi:hypothetical protein
MSRITTIHSLQNTLHTTASSERPAPTPAIAGRVSLIGAVLDDVVVLADYDAGAEGCLQAYSPNHQYFAFYIFDERNLQSPQGPQLKRLFWYGRGMMID